MLNVLLDGIDSLAAAELTDLRQQINDVVAFANNNQPLGKEPPDPAIAKLRQVTVASVLTLSERLPELNRK